MFKYVLLFTVLSSLSTQAAESKKRFEGHCAKAATHAAVGKWADVPNPSETLEYMPFSSRPSKTQPRTYEVVLAFSDGNEIVSGKYLVTFENLRNCTGAKVSN